jgi:hypothetical protein
MGYSAFVVLFSLTLMPPTISGKLGPDNSGCWGQFRLVLLLQKFETD